MLRSVYEAVGLSLGRIWIWWARRHRVLCTGLVTEGERFDRPTLSSLFRPFGLLRRTGLLFLRRCVAQRVQTVVACALSATSVTQRVLLNIDRRYFF